MIDLLDAQRSTLDAFSWLFVRHAPRAQRLMPVTVRLPCSFRAVSPSHFFGFHLGHKPSTTFISGMQGKRSGLHGVLNVVGFVFPSEGRKNDVFLLFMFPSPIWNSTILLIGAVLLTWIMACLSSQTACRKGWQG